MRRFHTNWILAGTAIFAFLWAVARAMVQSITIDEADTYLAWAARPNPSHWEAASNNHVLNSILMRLTTSVFGLTHLSVRAPALLGAALYIAMAFAMCLLLRVRWPLFAALVFNPFIFDHLVAARGYALAMGFLMAAIAAAAYRKPCWICSVCLALSFASNFSFGIVDGFTMAAITAWSCARTQGLQARARVVGACVLPGLLVTFFVSAPVVLHWPKGQLWYGSHSLREWLGEVVRDSLYELNPQIVNPMLMALLERVKPWLIPAVLALAAWQWARSRGNHFLYLLLAVTAASVAAHWAMFRIFGVLMPKERTAIWIVPLMTLAIGAVAEGRRSVTLGLYVLSFYFLLCLRLTSFREWYWDAEVNKAYAVVAYYNHAYGVREVSSNWMYASALNFYRLSSGRETLDEIPGSIPTARGRVLYVLNWVQEEQMIREEGLRVVYRGANTEIVVAARPEVEVGASCRAN